MTDKDDKEAILQYASEIKPEDVIAIDNRTKKIMGIGKVKGILFTKDAIFSSFFDDGVHLAYKDIMSSAMVVDGIRFKLRNGKSIVCDFGQSNDFILSFLSEIGIR